MLRLLVLCVFCLVLAAPNRALGVDPGSGAGAAHVLTTPEAALAFLTSIRRPLSVEEAARVEVMLRAAMDAAPQDTRWPIALAMLARYKGDIPDAMDLAQRAVQLEPGVANGWFALALALPTGGRNLSGAERADRTRAAVAALERALELDPSHLGAMELAIEYYTSAPASAGGNHDRAIELCDRMMSFEATRWRGAELRARVCMVVKDWAGVDEWFAKGIAWAPDPAIARELHRQQALLYVNFAKDYARAIQIATPYAVPGAPDADRFSFVIGQAAYRMNDCDLVVTHDQRVVDVGDPPPSVLMELADCLEKRGDLTGAARTLELFAVRFKGHPKEEQVLVSLNRLRAALRDRATDEKGPAPSPPSPAALGGTTPGG